MILLDTSVLIEILRKNNDILEKINTFSVIPLVTSEICIMELIYGLYGNKNIISKSELLKKKLIDVEKLCNKLIILRFDRACALKTGEIMGRLKISGNLIDFRDGMIACSALANGIHQIYTLNVSHFERIEELKIID